MLKGCRKQMIVLHGTASEIFDEAYFILKKGSESKTEQHLREGERTTMLLEANRILEENRIGGQVRGRGRYTLYYLLFFLCGIILGAGSIILTLAIS